MGFVAKPVQPVFCLSDDLRRDFPVGAGWRC